MRKHSNNLYSPRRSKFCCYFYFIASAAAVFSIPDISFNGYWQDLILPDTNMYIQKKEYFTSLLPYEEPIIINIFTDSASSSESIEMIHLQTAAEELKNCSLMKAVYSPIDFFSIPADTAFSEYNKENLHESNYSAHIKKELQQIPILKELFLSSDNDTFLIYAVPEENISASALGNYLDSFKKRWKDQNNISVAVMSSQYTSYLFQKFLFQELIQLCVLGFIFLGLVFFYFTGNAAASLIMLINCFIPSIILFGIYASADIPIDGITVYLPLLLFSLTTAYSIHYYKTYEICSKNASKALKKVGTIIILSCLTTIIGYANLLYIPSISIRNLGISLAAGLILSLFSVIFCLPYVLSFMKKIHPHKWEKKIRNSSYPAGRRAKILLAVYAAVLISASGGFYWYLPEWSFMDAREDKFGEGTVLAAESELFSKHNGNLEEITVFINTEEEYGLVDFSRFNAIHTLSNSLRSIPRVATVISYTDLTAYINGLLYDEKYEIIPRSSMEIGESLEFASSYSESIPLNMLIDMNYRSARMIIHFDTSGFADSHEISVFHDKLTEMIQTSIEKQADSNVFINSRLINQKEMNHFYRKNMARASLYFLISVFLIGLLLLKSFSRSIALLVPTLTSVVCYFGLSGWLKLPVGIFSIFGLYTLLGISMDDSIYLLLHLRKQEQKSDSSDQYKIINTVYHATGVNILETTLIIIAGLSAAFFSGSLNLVYTILVSTAAFIAATFTTLYVVPQLTDFSTIRIEDKVMQKNSNNLYSE